MTIPPVTGIETLVDDTRILMEIGDEMVAALDKHGIQNHPDGTGPDLVYGFLGRAREHADAARMRCDKKHLAGEGTFEQILTEEYAEALAEADPILLREKLLQVAAVGALWVAAIDRRQRDEEVSGV